MSEGPAISVAYKQHRLQQGFKLFELGVASAVFAIFVTVLLQRLSYYQEEAERVAVQQVVTNIKTALDIKLAQGRVPGHTVDLTMLSQQNPLNWLTEKPANYLGEFYAPRDQDVTGGYWYFDRYDKTLVYLLNNRRPFVDAPLKRLKFKVKLLRLPESPAKPAAGAEMSGVTFEQVNG